MAGGQSSKPDSTELLTDGASAWTEVAPLPSAMFGLQIVSVDNNVISTGEGKSLSHLYMI